MKQECNDFPRGVEASLVLHNSEVKNMLQATIRDFNYSITREIDFELVSYDDVTNATPTGPFTFFDVDYADVSNIQNFVDLGAFKTERLAVLRLFTFAELTQVHISSFNEQKSALTECFYDNSSVINDQTSAVGRVIITLFPTKLCSLQLVDGYAQSNTKLKLVTLTVGDSELNVPTRWFENYSTAPVIQIAIGIT